MADSPKPKPASKPRTRRSRKAPATVKPVIDAAADKARISNQALESAAAKRALARGSEDKARLTGAIERIRRMAAEAGITPEVNLDRFGGATREALRQGIQELAGRYSALIDQAAGTATRSYLLAATPVITRPDRMLPSVEVSLLEDLNSAVSRVSETVGNLAEAVLPMATVARDAQAALLRMEATAKDTLDESSKLRGSLEKGQKSADRAAAALIVATFVLIVLTGVLIYLTWILVTREAGA